MHGDRMHRRLRICPRRRLSARSRREDAALGGRSSAPGNDAPLRPLSRIQPLHPLLRGRPGTLPQLLMVAICVGYALGSALGWGSATVALFMGDFGLSAAALFAAASCFWYARTCPGPCPTAWLLFAGSSAMLGLGNGVWGWYEVVLGQPVPQPSLADVCFLLFAPLAIIGLLVLARRPVSRAGWVCLGLDAWLIGGSLLTLSWSLALAHATYWQYASMLRAALSLAYPLLDIVLVSMVLALHFRRSSANRCAVNIAIGAFALTVLCDALFSSPLLREHYRSGQLLDAGWFAGSMLLAYAPWGAARTPAVEPGDDTRTEPASSGPIAGSLSAITPYLAAGVCTLGILYHALAGREIDRFVLLTGCTVVFALVIRQGIMLLDNITLTQELAQKENHFRSLVQGSSDVIMIAAPSGVLRYVSPAATRVYGREADGLIGSQLSALIHPDDLGSVLHEVRRFLAAPPSEEPSTRIECRFRHGSGVWLNIESTINRYQGGLIFNSRDVTERVRLQAQLQHNASHDSLTDLPNRTLFTERVSQALTGRRSGDPATAVLFIDLDGFKAVNDTVGHQIGDELLIHAARRLRESVRAGDTAARLGGDEFAALILGDCARGHTEGGPPAGQSDREYRIREIADRLRVTLSQPYRIDGHELRVAASIGVAFAERGITPGGLMRNADLAMYRAKRAGKNRVELYAPHMQDDVAHGAASRGAGRSANRSERAVRRELSAHRAELAGHRAELVAKLRGTASDSGLVVHHQPVVELASGRISAVAAQAHRYRAPRARHARPGVPLDADRVGADDAPGGVAHPAGDGFDDPALQGSGAAGRRSADRAGPPLALPHQGDTPHGSAAPEGSVGGARPPCGDEPEAQPCDAGTEHPGGVVGDRLLEQAVEQAVQRRVAGFRTPVVVRLPVRQVTERAMGTGAIESLLTRYRVPSGTLILELVDCDRSVGLDELERRLTGLRRLGVVISLDGFGADAGALRALSRLPVDALRLDPGLVDGIAESTRLRKITSGLLQIAADLGLATIADGVDHPDQAAVLAALGCTHAQGRVFAGPLDEHRLRRALARGGYPVPSAPEGAVTGVGERSTGSRSMVVAGSIPSHRLAEHDGLPSWESWGDGPHSLTHVPFKSQ